MGRDRRLCTSEASIHLYETLWHQDINLLYKSEKKTATHLGVWCILSVGLQIKGMRWSLSRSCYNTWVAIFKEMKLRGCYPDHMGKSRGNGSFSLALALAYAILKTTLFIMTEQK